VKSNALGHSKLTVASYLHAELGNGSRSAFGAVGAA